MDDLLDGWKDISRFIGKSARTLQRWASEWGFPVRAWPGTGGVFAYKTEIREWLRTASLTVFQNPEVASEDAFSDEAPEIADQKLVGELLQLYYPEPDVRRTGLFRFTYSVDGARVVTNIVTSNSWLGLAISIDGRPTPKFSLETRNFSWPPTPESEKEVLGNTLDARVSYFMTSRFIVYNPSE